MSVEPFVELREKIESSDALVGVIGLGYVGLPLCFALHQGGLRVLGFDVDTEKVHALDEGRSYLSHFGETRSRALLQSPRFEATDDFTRLREPDVVIVCVPTPIGPHQEPDLSYVVGAARAIGRSLRRGQLVILESTTYPSTTRGEFLDGILETHIAHPPLEAGRDFFVAYSPEREDPGRRSHDTRTIPKLVGGLDDRSAELAELLYRRGVEKVIRVSSAEVAEAAKILENVFRAVNIALVNETKQILDAMGIDVWEVVEAASSKPFGFLPFYPGPGIGGHCISIDPFYLAWKAKEVGHPTRFIELAGAVNTAMPDFVVQKTLLGLNDTGKALRGSHVLVIGVAYKANVDDVRESPSFEIIRALRSLGAIVSYHDPHVPRIRAVRRHDLQMVSVDLNPETLSRFDAVIVATDHDAVDYGMVADHAALIVDTRNVMARQGCKTKGLLIKA